MKKNEKQFFCKDLPTSHRPDIGKILVTGATGYIGGRLVPELIERGYDVRVMVRTPFLGHYERWPKARIVVGDAMDKQSLERALKGIHTAYYLIHSLLLGQKKLEEAEIIAAWNFTDAASTCGVKRIIYLGGLGDSRAPLSPHLRSRLQVGEILSNSAVPTTILRAAIIIGSGSASYEIIEHLVKSNILIFFIPRWARTKCQPIAIRDVIKYLVGVLEKDETIGQSYDIGGDEILTYEEMLKILATLLKKKRLFVSVPVSNVGFFAYLAGLLTPVPTQIAHSLMASVVNEVICKGQKLGDIIPIKTYSFKEALIGAMTIEEKDAISTRWSDAYPPAHELALLLRDVDPRPRYTSRFFLDTKKSATDLFSAICQIGRKRGWFNTNYLWRLRGLVDRILMGVGSSRGRRASSSIRINDVIDFWRVEDLIKDRFLLLRAEMKLPGRAWLEFRISAKQPDRRLIIKAWFQHNGILGIIYWYLFLPLHKFIFKNLIEQIEKRA
jgi:uncharacterized protein YbjT (DUF2867 family)